MARGPSRPYPSVSLEDATALVSGLYDHNAGRPMNRILLAQALGMAPAGTVYRDYITAANKFGLINGNYNSEMIDATPLGNQVAKPRSEEERIDALRQAMRKVSLFSKLLDHYSNSRLPAVNILKSALELPPFSVDKTWSKEAAEVFTNTGKFTGLIRDVGGALYVVLDAGPPVSEDIAEDFEEDIPVPNVVVSLPQASPTANAPAPPSLPSMSSLPADTSQPAVPSTRQFFVAHGRDKTALAQLQSILKDLDIPYLVAEQEANVGRPISQKIADLMRACSAGIFIFSGDEEVRDVDGNVVRRPRPNVVFELGAASFQYGQRVVIFKEQGVEFPTDFRDLGYIEYVKDHLSEKSMELLRELVKLKAVKLMPGS